MHPYLIACDKSPMPHPRHDPDVSHPGACNLHNRCGEITYYGKLVSGKSHLLIGLNTDDLIKMDVSSKLGQRGDAWLPLRNASAVRI